MEGRMRVRERGRERWSEEAQSEDTFVYVSSTPRYKRFVLSFVSLWDTV